MIDRLGRRLPTTLGLVILAVGVLPIALAGQDVSIPTLLAGLALVGVGLGLASPALQTSGVEAVESDQAGSAAGLYSTSRYLGSITGSAIIAGILGASDMDVDGLSLVFLLSFVAAVVAQQVRSAVEIGDENIEVAVVIDVSEAGTAADLFDRRAA